MAPTRRTHTKSRGGCYECKRRKIKCDEQKPICSGCQKRAILSCEYPSPGSSPHAGDVMTSRSENAVHANVAPKSTPVGPPVRMNGSLPALAPLPPREIPSPLVAPRIRGQFNMEDMNLWHKFVTLTGPTIEWVVECEVHTLSLSCDYLMHGVMSTAALHLAYLNPEQRVFYEDLSTQHQNLALGPFRSEMLDVTPDNCHRVFAFSLLLLVSQYASARSVDFLLPSPEVTSSRLVSWIFCLRGCVSIARQATSHIRNGPLGTVLTTRSHKTMLTEEATLPYDDEDSQSLEKLNRYITSLPSIKASTTIAEMEAYTESISYLRKMLAASSRSTDVLSNQTFASYWPIQLSDTFIRLVTERRAPAMAIMAHYCLLLNRCHSCWYMEHRGKDLFETVQQSLTEEWAPSVEHPRRVFSGS